MERILTRIHRGNGQIKTSKCENVFVNQNCKGDQLRRLNLGPCQLEDLSEGISLKIYIGRMFEKNTLFRGGWNMTLISVLKMDEVEKCQFFRLIVGYDLWE